MLILGIESSCDDTSAAIIKDTIILMIMIYFSHTNLNSFKILKIKTGLDINEDIERVAKLKEKFGNYFIIRVDANQGYTATQTKQFIDATSNLGLELIEQPIKVGQEKTIEELSEGERKILCGDESLKNPTAALHFAALQYFGIYNIMFKHFETQAKKLGSKKIMSFVHVDNHRRLSCKSVGLNAEFYRMEKRI